VKLEASIDSTIRGLSSLSLANLQFGNTMPLVLGVAGALIFASLAVLAPLGVYTLTLAIFGLPHVLSELRYVDRRFGCKLGNILLRRGGLLLALIVIVRTLLVFHFLAASIEVPIELSLVALLAFSAVGGPFGPRWIVAMGIAMVLAIATAFSPYDTVITLAVLHNLTPLGFLWQIAPRNRRGPIMGLAIFALLGLPLCVATGLPRMVLSELISSGLPFDPLHAGTLSQNLFAYVPLSLMPSQHAVDYFTASVNRLAH
jgi:hypothetical protein